MRWCRIRTGGWIRSRTSRGGGRTTERERERGKELPVPSLSLSLSVLFVISGGMLSGAAALNLWFLRRFLKLIQRQWQWGGVFLSEAVSADPESVMSVLKRNRHSKRSSDSIYDMLHLVKSRFMSVVFLKLCYFIVF